MISIQLIFNIRSGGDDGTGVLRLKKEYVFIRKDNHVLLVFIGKKKTIVNKCYRLDDNVFSALM